MCDEFGRITTAQWILERTLAWITAAEVKVGIIVAIDTAMLGGVGASYSTSDAAARTSLECLLVTVAATPLAAGLFCAAMAVLPRLSGPAKSLVFFGRIAETDEAGYVDQVKQFTSDKLLEDLAAQIHRNAEIASDKYAWVRASMWWSFLSVVPWFPTIIILSKK